MINKWDRIAQGLPFLIQFPTCACQCNQHHVQVNQLLFKQHYDFRSCGNEIMFLYWKATIPSTTTSTTSTTTTTTTTRPTTTTTIPTTTIAQTTTAGYKCPSTGNFPYEGSCSLYYVCSSNGYIIAVRSMMFFSIQVITILRTSFQSCPPGEVFNPDIEFCEPPGNVAGCTFNLTAYLRVWRYLSLLIKYSFFATYEILFSIVQHLRNAVAHRYECKVQTEAQQQR